MKRFDVFSWVGLCLALTVAGEGFAGVDTATKTAAAPNGAAPYLAAVRQFADQVLTHGRDAYGKPTPLFVDGLNVDTREPVKWKWADGKEWVLCNLANQQGLFRALDGLSRLTGDLRYKDAALEATRYAFDHLRYGTQNNGGLLAWGGHLAYNATDDVLAGNPGGTGRIHELKCFFPHYQLMWEANPKATQELIENIWNGHVLDWATLDFNRHGSPNKRGRLWQNEYRGGEVFFWGKGLTFHNAGSDFYFAAGMLTKLAGAPEPLVWARRLSQRYVETRDPKTGLEGYLCKKDGYFGPKGKVLRAGHPGPEHFWVYALAFRLSGDKYLWEMARNIARGNGWGEIGETPKATPKLKFPDNLSDPRLLFALLELHRTSANAVFLAQAEVIGRNILKQRVRNGWFIPSQRHVFCRVGNDESQALLHLAAALMGKPEAVPAFTGAQPFFQAEYGTSTGRVYDAAGIYGRTR